MTKFYNLRLNKEEIKTILSIIKFYKSENHYFKNNVDINNIENEVKRTIIRNNLD